MPGTKGCRLDSLKSQRESAGHSVTTLAKKANVSDLAIRRLEAGGNIENHEAQRIADALGVSLATLGQSKL
jgi:ribosome-binding protein aMBF1 (putative translation factor)